MKRKDMPPKRTTIADTVHKYLNPNQTIGNTMTDQVQQEIPTLTVDGVNFPINNLPDDIKELIAVYQEWETSLNQQKKEVFKTEAAMRAVSSEIQTRVRNMAAAAAASMAKSEEAAANDAPPAHVETVESEGGTPD